MRMRCRAAASLPPAYRSCSRESGSPGLLMRPHVAPRRVLDRLELALARHARARRRHRFGIARLEPVDPIGPPASLRLGRAVDQLAQRFADRVVALILIFARARRVDPTRAMPLASQNEPDRALQGAGVVQDTLG